MFTNIFGEKFKRNPNTVDVELLKSEIATVVAVLRQYVDENNIPQEVRYWLYDGIIEKLENALTSENINKSYQKSILGSEKENRNGKIRVGN